MKTWLKWTLGVFGGLVLLALVMGGGAPEQETGGDAGAGDAEPPATTTAPTTTETTPPATTSPPTATTPPAAPSPEPLSFEGSGKRVTDEFTTQEGLVRMQMRHDGSSNFIVWLLDAETGEREELAVNAIGAYDGARYFPLPPGRYVMDVTADGAWSVTLAQPRPTEGRAPPTSDSGDGDAAPEPIRLTRGLHQFAMTHAGEGNFIVWLLDAEGNRVELLANEIGAWNGETAVGIPRDGVYVLDVVADGAWTLRTT